MIRSNGGKLRDLTPKGARRLSVADPESAQRQTDRLKHSCSSRYPTRTAASLHQLDLHRIRALPNSHIGASGRLR